MSAPSRWDQQLLQTEMRIVELLKEVSRNPDPITSNATVNDRDQIDHALAQIAVDVDKVILAARKAQKGSRSNAAIGWWTKQLALKVKIVAQELVALQNRKMWLRLLQARFASTKPKDTIDLQAKHLVDLALRKRHLEELENALNSDMELVASERGILKNEYESLGTADENWSASGSFQSRLGINFQHARDNPSTRAFSDCLNVISVPIVHPEEGKWLRKVNDDLMRKSGSLSEQCKEIASAIAKGTGIADKISTAQFRNTMDQVISLNEQVTRKIAAIRRRPLKQSRPKLVQNHKKDDKTVAHP